MSNDNKTLADVQPGGRVRLEDQAERARFEAFLSGNPLIALSAGTAWQVWQAALSAQPSPGGQGGLNYERMFVDACAALAEVSRELGCDPEQGGAEPILAAIAELRAGLAARQPVGELHLPPDGFYKIVFDDAEVPDESFARSGALDAALRRFEQISNKWNAHLFVRFANNTRDCTVPNAKPAQAVDLGRWSQRHADDLHVAVHTALSVHAGSLSQKKRAAISAYVKRLLIDSQAVGNG